MTKTPESLSGSLEGWARDMRIADGIDDEDRNMLFECAIFIRRQASIIKAKDLALEPFATAAEDADEPSVADTCAAWESAMAMSVTFGDFRNTATARALTAEGEK